MSCSNMLRQFNILFAVLTIFIFIEEIKSNPPITDEDIVIILDEHNKYRGTLDPSAPGMPKLTWNSSLAASAQGWVDQCIPEFPPSNNSEYADVGVNYMFQINSMVPVNFTEIIGSWNVFGEGYNYASNNCKLAPFLCGFYKQLVSEKATKLGCGLNKCPRQGNEVYLLFCFYQEKPNLKARPYTNGTACTTCPDNLTTCEENLCVLESSTSTTTSTKSTTSSTEVLTTEAQTTQAQTTQAQTTQAQTTRAQTTQSQTTQTQTTLVPKTTCKPIYTTKLFWPCSTGNQITSGHIQNLCMMLSYFIISIIMCLM